MKVLTVVFAILAIMLWSIGLASACSKEGYVYCDVNGDGTLNPTDDEPIQGVEVIIENDSLTWSDSATTDSSGYFIIWLPEVADDYHETINEATLPQEYWDEGFSYVFPAGGVFYFSIVDVSEHLYNEWLIDSDACREEGLCWLTGGGVKFEPIIGENMAEHGPKDSLGGNVYPGCNPDSGEGGQWNHIAHKLKLHFQGWTIEVVKCGNVPGIPPGSDSPDTPYNYIEFMGTGTLKGIHGNKMETKDVLFYARCEDRNEPGSNGAKDGALIDRYFLRVYDPTSITDPYPLLIDEDGDPATIDPITITGGNLQIHISSCDTPPM